MKARLLGEMTEEFKKYDDWVVVELRNSICAEAEGDSKSCIHISWIADIIEANTRIWILESDIRNGKDMPLEEVGRRALQIRDINRMRIEAKNKINEIFGDYQEIKVNHASERSNLEN
jgi:hypothetical protein